MKLKEPGKIKYYSVIKGKHATTGKFITKSGQSKITKSYFLFVKEKEFDNKKDRFNEDVNSSRDIYKI